MCTHKYFRTLGFFVLIPSLLLQFSGCGLLFGGSQKVDNKSHDYTLKRLDHEKSKEWRFLAPVADLEESNKDDVNEIEAADYAYEHIDSGSIISLNSVCAKGRDASLEELTKNLLMGLDLTSEPKSEIIKVDGETALSTTVMATSPKENFNVKSVLVRAVVVKKQGCTYDFMMVAKQNIASKISKDFNEFLKGFHVE